jgi:hypothetical protein
LDPLLAISYFWQAFFPGKIHENSSDFVHFRGFFFAEHKDFVAENSIFSQTPISDKMRITETISPRVLIIALEC